MVSLFVVGAEAVLQAIDKTMTDCVTSNEHHKMFSQLLVHGLSIND